MIIDRPWQMLATPNANEFSFRTLHDPDAKLAWFTTAGDNGRPIDEETLYKNWVLREPKRADADYGGIWGDYVYTGASMGEGGVVIFTWALEKTMAVQNIPYRTYAKELGNHHWPSILKALNIMEDSTFGVSADSISGNDIGKVVAPRYYQQDDFINDVQEGSRFMVSEFFGPRPFNIPRHQVPMPGRINYQTVSSGGSFPESLHDDVEIPPTRTATSKNVGGTTTSVGGSLDGQFFPATNFRSWRPYVFADSQVRTETGWHRTLIRVFPPSLPRRILRNS